MKGSDSGGGGFDYESLVPESLETSLGGHVFLVAGLPGG